MAWRSKLSLWPEFTLIGAIAACAAGVYFTPAETPTILLLDRPREDASQTDFIHEFLEVTQTPYTLREGFVQLDANPENERRLLQLLSALTAAVDIAERNAVLSGPEGRKRVFPTPDGSVHVVDDRTKGNAFPPPTVDVMRRQYDVVLAAIRTLRPGAVGRPPGETVITTVPTAPRKENPVQPASWVKPESAFEEPRAIERSASDDEEIVELMEVDHEPLNREGRNQ